MTRISPIDILGRADSLEVSAHTNAAAANDTIGQVTAKDRIKLSDVAPAPDRFQVRVADPMFLGQGPERAFISLVAYNAGRGMI